MIYYNKMIMIRSNKNIVKTFLLIYENLYIKNFLKSYNSIILNSKNEMNPIYLVF